MACNLESKKGGRTNFIRMIVYPMQVAPDTNGVVDDISCQEILPMNNLRNI